jgi:polyphosphate kinase
MVLKMNQLEEDVMIQKLYEASQAGVQIDLIVRGFSCLRPGIPGYSENIRVRSHVGRFLEHSRVFYFQNAPQDQRIYLGSADLMRRNLYNRVEVVFPVLDKNLQARIMRILANCLLENEFVWEMLPDGTYRRISAREGEVSFDSQNAFMQDSLGIEAVL